VLILRVQYPNLSLIPVDVMCSMLLPRCYPETWARLREATMATSDRAKDQKITLRRVRDLLPNTEIFDAGPGAVTAFGARRREGSAVSYFVLYRTVDGRQRRYTIGRHGSPWTPDTARETARAVLSHVKIEGGDPGADKQAKRHALTVADLCKRYLGDAESGRLLVRGGRPKKALTLASDRGRIEGHIIPLLGRLPVAAVTKQDVEKFMHAVAAGETAQCRKVGPRAVSNLRGGRGVAGRSVSLLGAIFTYAIDQHMRADNPAHRVRKFAENKRTRRLTDDEYAALGAGLRQAEATVWPPAVACLHFLALTGWRSGEAVSLRWQDVDVARRTATLPDTKTGQSMRALSYAACDVLKRLTRMGDSALVFPASRGDGLMLGFKKFARRIVAMSGLPADVTPHVLRHSFASLAADLEYSESTIGALLGHKSQSITGRYVHAADAVMLAAADAVANETAARMGDAKPVGEVVPFRSAG
jgi:integrase